MADSVERLPGKSYYVSLNVFSFLLLQLLLIISSLFISMSPSFSFSCTSTFPIITNIPNTPLTPSPLPPNTFVIAEVSPYSNSSQFPILRRPFLRRDRARPFPLPDASTRFQLAPQELGAKAIAEEITLGLQEPQGFLQVVREDEIERFGRDSDMYFHVSVTHMVWVLVGWVGWVGDCGRVFWDGNKLRGGGG